MNSNKLKNESSKVFLCWSQKIRCSCLPKKLFKVFFKWPRKISRLLNNNFLQFETFFVLFKIQRTNPILLVTKPRTSDRKHSTLLLMFQNRFYLLVETLLFCRYFVVQILKFVDQIRNTVTRKGSF